MANTYIFNRDSIQVNGRTFPARYEVKEFDGEGRYNTVYIFAAVEGGETMIEVPNTDAAHAAALEAAQGAQEAAPVEAGQEAGPVEAAQVETAEAAPVETAEAATVQDDSMVEEAATVAAGACDADPADVETVNPAGVDADPADVETVTAADAATAAAETIDKEEAENVKKQENATATAAEAVKVEAVKVEAAPVEAAAVDDPKATRGVVPEKTFKNEVIAGKGWSIVFDAGCNRTRVIISEPVKAAARPIVEAEGFYYSRALDSWNKKLTFRAYRAAVNLAEKLRAALA